MIKEVLVVFFLGVLLVGRGQSYLYDQDQITEIRLTFDDPNWDATMDTYYANDLDELLNATCEINGEVTYYNVGVSYKGNSTYDASNAKNPLKIKLAANYYQAYQNYRTLKLSNGKNDPSFVREVLSYEIGRKYMDIPLSNYAKVYINGDYYGLFSSSESINGDFMEKRFYCDDDNVRFKCNPSDVMGGNGSSLMYLGADSSSYYDYYELKSDFGWGRLVELCNQIQTNTVSIEDYIDVDRALWMLAFNNVLANMDSYSGPFRQNYYLIIDNNDRFVPVIWDLNESIGGFEMVNMPSGGPPSPPSLTDLTEMDPYLRESDDTFPLIYYLFQNDRYRKMYLAHCKTMLEENITNGWYYTRAQELQAVIDAEVQNDPNAFYTYSDFTSNLDNSTGSGQNGAYGIAEVLDARGTFLSNHADYNLTQPTITNITTNPAAVVPNSQVIISAEISNATYAYLGTRDFKADVFSKTQLFDDGLHGDGAAGDGVWATSLAIGSANIQYYIYAENSDAGIFSPERAEHEFHELEVLSDVVINEIMPSNNVTAADQYLEYDDWIELYNNSSSSIDLTAYYLSDDPNDLMKWEIPVGTTIAPDDYLIVWADGQTSQAGLHASFSISASGETIILSDPTGSPINIVEMPQIVDNATYGRYPNGTGGFEAMWPTFEAENVQSPLEVKTDELVSLIIYPNPVSESFVISVGLETVEVVVFDLNGKQQLNQMYNQGDRIDVSNWSKGTYVVFLPELNQSRKLLVH